MSPGVEPPASGVPGLPGAPGAPPAPRAGPQDAVPATPPRPPGSVRRTKSVDITRPDGLLGRIVAEVRGQDVVTGAGGAGQVIDRVALAIEIDPRRGEILAVRGPTASSESSESSDSPGSPETAEALARGGAPLPKPRPGLVGANARKGFGRRLAELLPDEAERRSLLYSALDDLSGALWVSGFALLSAGLIQPTPERGEQMAAAQADVCIGWARGGPLAETLRRTGASAVPVGPAAPAIEGDDPLGWHPMAALAAGTVRRRRRLDLVAPAGGDQALVALSHFRDSHAGDDGEMVMHEYLVDATVDARRRITGVAVDPRVLPWHECPGAVASAQQLVGMAVAGIPTRARTDLTGPHTCTHLTSTLRALTDIPALAHHLPPA